MDAETELSRLREECARLREDVDRMLVVADADEAEICALRRALGLHPLVQKRREP
jgi:hypothetical protein